MKRLLILTALLPFTVFAQPLNNANQNLVNPSQQRLQTQMQGQQQGMLNQQLQVNPSQQRLQTQMQIQQQDQKSMLNQQLQNQSRQQQQHLESQINNNTQRVRQAQPGELNPSRQQFLPNTGGGMLSGGVNGEGVQQQHMLPQNSNSSVQQTAPQATIPLKTLTP